MMPDLTTPTQGVKWPVGIGEWTEAEKPVLCESGWHGVERKDVLEHLPYKKAVLWRVECRGAMVHGDNKFAAESMRLVEIVAEPSDKELRLFMCDVAESVLHIFEEERPQDLRPRQSIETARRYANGEATDEELADARAAAWAAARVAAWADVWGAAAGAAAWDAARAHAWDAARDAARDAAWADARDAAWVEYSELFAERIGL